MRISTMWWCELVPSGQRISIPFPPTKNASSSFYSTTLQSFLSDRSFDLIFIYFNAKFDGLSVFLWGLSLYFLFLVKIHQNRKHFARKRDYHRKCRWVSCFTCSRAHPAINCCHVYRWNWLGTDINIYLIQFIHGFGIAFAFHGHNKIFLKAALAEQASYFM